MRHKAKRMFPYNFPHRYCTPGMKDQHLQYKYVHKLPDDQ